MPIAHRINPHSHEPELSVLDRVRLDPALVTTAVFHGPFGDRPLIYADDTASGRGLAMIEQTISDQILPFYANTHSEASFAGRRTGALREAARQAIRRGVGADQRHSVIFTGSGATAGINKLVALLGLAAPSDDTLRDTLLAEMKPEDRPVVLVGPYEHHSNDLPWRESLAQVVRIPLGADGQISLPALTTALQQYQQRPRIIGAFSAASNVTGIKTNIGALTQLLHSHGALCVVDYAAGAPYLPIDMLGDGLDAIVFSPHKFVGGPGASGVLVVDRALPIMSRPSAPGGGTVSFVSPGQHAYLENPEAREEAGTPAILGDIRAGLAMQLKSDIGQPTIETCEAMAVRRVEKFCVTVPEVQVLGTPGADRLAIFAFNIVIAGRALHHTLVVTLLNDLFGIQGRGGCSCAGPYGHDLLSINAAVSEQYRAVVADGFEAMKPGWVRLGFPPVMDSATIDFILQAIGFIAQRGLDLMALYQLDPHSGHWALRHSRPDDVASFDQLCAWRNQSRPDAIPRSQIAPDLIFQAAEQIADLGKRNRNAPAHPLPERAEPLRWFHL